MKRKWVVGERVVQRDGGSMIGKITRVGRSRAAGVTVRWPNGTETMVGSDEIRIPLPYRLERFRDIFEE